MWEFPAGLIDEDETPEQASVRELSEETGLIAQNAILLGSQTPIAGLVGEHFHTVLTPIDEIQVEDVTLQADESIVEANLVSRAELVRMVVDQEIEDGVTLYSLARYWAYMETEGRV